MAHQQLDGNDVSTDQQAAPSPKLLSPQAGIYSAVLQSLTAGIILYDLHGRAIECNASAARILGVPPAAILQTPLHDPAWHVTDEQGRRITPEEYPALICLNTGQPITQKIISVTRGDGAKIWLSVSAQPVIPPDSTRHTMAAVCFEDITEKRKNEEALRLSEERYRTLIEHSPDAITVIDAETLRYVDLNRRAESLFLMSRQEILHSTPLEVSPDTQPDGVASATRLTQLINAARRGQNVHCEWLHRRKTGEAVLCEIRLACLPSTERTLIRVSATDITAQRRSREHFRIIAEQTGQIIYEYDLRTGEILWSGAIFPTTGHTPEEFRRVNADRWAEMIHPEDRPHALEALDRVIHHGGRYEVQYRFARKDGSYVPIEDHGVVLRDDQGIPTVMLGTMGDLSHRRQQEAIRVELEAQLRHSQKLEAIGTLAGGIAHDFNNLLGAIMGYTELARFEAADHPCIQAHLAEVLKASERARDLVRQILTFSRKQAPNLRPIDLAACLHDTIRLLRATLPSSIQIVSQIEAPVCIRGDAALIEQVLINLATNAAHAIGSKNGRIDIRLSLYEVRRDGPPEGFPSLTPGPYALLSVTDNGSGMDEDTLKRIFEPFFTTKAPGEGTGLGLSVVHGIISDHSGAIAASSTPGQGSAFRILIPATVESLESSDQDQPLRPGRGQHILVVDDEIDLCRATAHMLEILGYRATTESDPQEAARMVREGILKPDLVLLDLAMPGLTGDKLAADLHAVHPRLPIILISGYGEAWPPEKAHACGIRRIMAKPIRSRDLAAVLHQTLQPAGSGTTGQQPADQP